MADSTPRPRRRGGPPRPTRAPDAGGDPRDLQGFVDELMATGAYKLKPPTYAPVPWGGWRFMPALAIVMAVLGGVVYLTARPTPPPPIEAQRTEPKLREMMFVMAMQIEAFRDSARRLPEDLAELGDGMAVAEGVTYTRIGPTAFTLTADVNANRRIVLDSRSDPTMFLFGAPLDIPRDSSALRKR